MDNLEFLRNVGYGKAIDTVDDKPVETIPGVGQEFSEDTGFTPGDAARLFLPVSQGGTTASDSAEDLVPASDVKTADVLSVGAFSANAVVDVPASRFNAASIPVVGPAVKLVDVSPSRLAITIYNPPGGGILYIGSNAAVGTGYSSFPIISGSSLTMAVSSEIWVSASAASTCAYIEYLI
jgi:hypothetical protein